MSTSFNKLLGYGLTDVITDSRGAINDPRVNSQSPLISSEGEDDESFTVRNFFRQKYSDPEVAERVTNNHSYLGDDRFMDSPLSLIRTCSHMYETRIPNVIILRPFTSPGWFRRNDIIDQFEESNIFCEGMKDSVIVSSGGIYPFANNYIDLTTLEKVDWSAIADWIRATNTKTTFDELDRVASEACEILGIEVMDHASLSSRIVPQVPSDIVEVAAFGNLFNNPNVAHTLRPMLVKAWR